MERHRMVRKWLAPLLMVCVGTTWTLESGRLSSAQAFTPRNLAYGSQGYDVDELQGRLKLLGYYWEKVDGNFGWDTYWAVRTFQYNFGMKATGFVDMVTKMKLAKATPNWHPGEANRAGTRTNSGTRVEAASQAPPKESSSNSSSSFPNQVHGLTSQDMQLMTQVVYGEARGEPFNGQVAIAAVILNRLQDPRFPHSIPAIIYSPGAFTCTSDGQVNLVPDAEARKAVMDAIHGWDPADGAVYYYNPATATSPWIWSRPEITQIGHHIFCR